MILTIVSYLHHIIALLPWYIPLGGLLLHIITIDVLMEVTKSSSRWENMNQLEPRTSISKWSFWVPSGKHTKNYGTSPFLMGKSTISTGPCSNAMQQIARGYMLWCFMTFLLCWDVGSIENHYGMMIREPRVESRRFFLKKRGSA